MVPEDDCRWALSFLGAWWAGPVPTYRALIPSSCWQVLEQGLGQLQVATIPWR